MLNSLLLLRRKIVLYPYLTYFLRISKKTKTRGVQFGKNKSVAAYREKQNIC